jgi:hypothetical protein
MRLRLLAPFRSHFRLSLGYTLKTGRLSAFSKDYLEFWNGLQEAAAEVEAGQAADIRFLHSGQHLGPDAVRYTTIDADTLRYTAELIDIRPKEITALVGGELQPTVDELAHRRTAGKAAWDKLAARVSLVPRGTVVRVFDNNISLFEAEIDVTEILAKPPSATLDQTLDDIRELAVFCGEVLIQRYYSDDVYPLLRSLAEERDAGHVFIDPLFTDRRSMRDVQGLDEFEYPLARDGHHDRPSTEVLWVTRSLVCDDEDKKKLPLPSIARTWLRAVGDRNLTETVADRPDAYSTRWLNYLFREGFVVANGGNDFRNVWEAMRLCQYYYSAVESLNDRLNRVLSFANQDKAKGRLRDLHAYLDDVVRRCELVLASYNEMQKYFNRDKFQAFRKIMEYWNFEEMEEKEVREKMSVCRSRLESLSDQASEKGRLYTDILLMVVSLLAVLDMSITLALFGRSPTDTVYAQDVTYSGYILAYVARLQPHIIIIFAFGLIVALGLRFYFFRRRRLLYD